MPGDMTMSSIANQMMAVAATLMGFVAHDALTDRTAAPATQVAGIVQGDIHAAKTRAIDLDVLSADWLDPSPRAERAFQPRPTMPVSSPTAAARTDPSDVEPEFARVGTSSQEQAPASRGIEAGFLR